MKTGSGGREKPANLREMLRFGEEYLAEHGVADAPVDAWLLLEYVTGLSRAQYLARAAEPLERVCETLRTARSLEKSREILCEEEATSGSKLGMNYGVKRSSDVAAEIFREYRELLEQRGGHIPLQHLTGEQEFMGLTFRVNKHVLIPRQDTETLVEEALARLRPGMRVLDLCTGSGCIAVSLAKLGPEYLARQAQKDRAADAELQKLSPEHLAWQVQKDRAADEKLQKREASAEHGESASEAKGCAALNPAFHIDASDISTEAVAVARENAQRLDAQVRFIESNLFAGITETNSYDGIDRNIETNCYADIDGIGAKEQIAGKNRMNEMTGTDGTSEINEMAGSGSTGFFGQYDMIVSNPPYIRTAVIGELAEEVRLHEPVLALDGSDDGLYFYREIVRQSPAHLTDGGWLLFEIGYDQAEAVRGLMAEAGFAEIEVIRDLAGNDRVVCGRYC